MWTSEFLLFLPNSPQPCTRGLRSAITNRYANAVGPYKCGVFTRAEVGASENRSHTAAERPTRGADILHILRHATHPRASSCLTRLACSLILLLLERVEQRRGCPVGHGTSHHADDPNSAEAEENVHGWAVE